MSPIGIMQADTLRPDVAGLRFVQALRADGLIDRTWRVTCELAGARSEAGCSRVVGTAILLGLEGETAEGADSPTLARRLRRIHHKSELRLLDTRRIGFDRRRHLISTTHGAPATGGSAVRLSAFDPAGSLLLERSYQVSHPVAG